MHFIKLENDYHIYTMYNERIFTTIDLKIFVTINVEISRLNIMYVT